jgi:hypothetical protein
MSVTDPSIPQQGLTLSQALERYSSSDDWKTYQELEPYRLTVVFLDKGYLTPEEQKYFDFLQLQNRLETHICELLGSGELVASGHVQPLTLNAERVTVSPDKWRLLSVDFENSTAKGHGLFLVDITVGEPASFVGKGRKPDSISKKQEIHFAFEELLNAGKVNFGRGGLAVAVRQLSPHFPDYKPDSIRRILQPTFKSYVKAKKPVRK